MNLAAFASFICTKINQTDPEDVAACKMFLSKNFDVIWAEALWKDSLFEYTQTVASTGYTVTSTWLPTKQVLILPKQISHVVAVRTDTRKLDLESSERLYRMDADSFTQQGSSTQYRDLSKAAWEFDTPQTVLVLSTPANQGATGLLDYTSSDQVTQGRVSLDLGTASTQIANVSRVDAFTKPATSGLVLLAVGPSLTVFQTIPATGTASPKLCRVQLLGKVADNTVIRVLGKIDSPSFDVDTDEPALTGVDNALISFTQADMLQRERQYAKAQLCQQQGIAFLQQLKRVQTTQQAFNKRFIPQDGYVWDYQQFGSGPLTF